jgi:8-hydroxy-5-deazaflavin:NADPH oxidoreductase
MKARGVHRDSQSVHVTVSDALGSKWRAAGYDVVYGSRSGSGEGPGGAPAMAVGGALADADVVLLAVPGRVVADVVGQHAAALAGKVVIDATNSMGGQSFNSRSSITAAAPDAQYVRAFNSLGWENFVSPPAGADLSFAADPAGRPAAEELIRAVGLEPVFVGDPGQSGTVDGLLPLWFALVKQHGGNRKIALRVVQ